MTYRRNNKKTKYVISLVVLLSVVYFFGGAIEKKIAGLTHFATGSIWSTEANVEKNSASVFSVFKNKSKLLDENILLKKELNKAELKLLSKNILLEENKSLKEILGRVDSNDDLLLSVVLSRPSASPYDTIVIDVGSTDGVSAGDTVLAVGGIAIGEIAKVLKRTSVVELFSSAGKITTVLLGENNLSVEIKGLGGQNFEVYLPRDNGISEGDFAIASNISLIPVAIVGYIEKSPNSPAEKILLKSPININELKFIQVLSMQDKEENQDNE